MFPAVAFHLRTDRPVRGFETGLYGFVWYSTLQPFITRAERGECRVPNSSSSCLTTHWVEGFPQRYLRQDFLLEKADALKFALFLGSQIPSLPLRAMLSTDLGWRVLAYEHQHAAVKRLHSDRRRSYFFSHTVNLLTPTSGSLSDGATFQAAPSSDVPARPSRFPQSLLW
jgi:hypothetical protein